MYENVFLSIKPSRNKHFTSTFMILWAPYFVCKKLSGFCWNLFRFVTLNVFPEPILERSQGIYKKKMKMYENVFLNVFIC